MCFIFLLFFCLVMYQDNQVTHQRRWLWWLLCLSQWAWTWQGPEQPSWASNYFQPGALFFRDLGLSQETKWRDFLCTASPLGLGEKYLILRLFSFWFPISPKTSPFPCLLHHCLALIKLLSYTSVKQKCKKKVNLAGLLSWFLQLWS